MVAFTKNCCINGLQLFNSIQFLAVGISKQINQYLHLLGLTSSRQTALSTLKTFKKSAEKDLCLAMAPNDVSPIGPSICIKKLDFEERVHAHSIGHC